MPVDNILAEPEARNTAPCIAYACWKIQKKHPEANNSDTPSQDSSSQKPSTPSSAPSSAESGKKGCGGSVIVASSLTGALGLFAAGLAVRALGKKKKED